MQASEDKIGFLEQRSCTDLLLEIIEVVGASSGWLAVWPLQRPYQRHVSAAAAIALPPGLCWLCCKGQGLSLCCSLVQACLGCALRHLHSHGFIEL